MKRISVKINGDTWKASLLDERSFYDKYGEDALAICHYDHNKDIRLMDFLCLGFSKSTVTHEVVHAYLSYIDFSTRSVKDIEEKFCDLLGSRAYHMLRVADTIYRRLKP